MNDEHHLIQRLGLICPNPVLLQINWSEKTGRVSASWTLSVGEQVSIAKWGLIALPNDIVKREKFIKWLRRNPEKVSEAGKQAVSEGHRLKKNSS